MKPNAAPGEPDAGALALSNKWKSPPQQPQPEPDSQPASVVEPIRRTTYSVQNGCLCIEKVGKKGPTYHTSYCLLCTFAASIVTEEVHDDGAEQRIFYRIEGTLSDGTSLPSISVPSDIYDNMDWVSIWWPSQAYIVAGQGMKDAAREAIKANSHAHRRTLIKHTGWRLDGDAYAYLHAGGALGAEGSVSGLSVEFGDDVMNSYRLPEIPDAVALKAAIQASLSMLEVAPDSISVPLLAAAYLAPLAHFINLDVSLFVVGMSGSQKSELTALTQAHYGAAFDRMHLPANWESTENSLEKQAFLAKDAVLVIDDFVAKGSTSDVERLHKAADRLLRGQGNGSGRARMNADGSLRARYKPRGLIISSGEDVPKGHSLGARLVTLQVERGAVDLPRLTVLQRAARQGLLATALAGYVCWLARDANSLTVDLAERVALLRDAVRDEGITDHDRTPNNLALLFLGFERLLIYAQDVGALDEAEATTLADRAWKSLLGLGGVQAGAEEESNDAERFLRLLASAFLSGAVHLTDRQTDDGAPTDYANWGWATHKDITDRNPNTLFPRGERIGWHDARDGILLLDANLAHATAQKIARAQGQPLLLSSRTLWGRLKAAGALATYGKNQNTVNKSVCGKEQRVLCVYADKVLPAATVVSEQAVGPRRVTKLKPAIINTREDGASVVAQ